MKKSELIQKLIEIEKKQGNEKATITMNYIYYLEKLKKLVEVGDIELENDKPN